MSPLHRTRTSTTDWWSSAPPSFPTTHPFTPPPCQRWFSKTPPSVTATGCSTGPLTGQSSPPPRPTLPPSSAHRRSAASSWTTHPPPPSLARSWHPPRASWSTAWLRTFDFGAHRAEWQEWACRSVGLPSPSSVILCLAEKSCSCGARTFDVLGHHTFSFPSHSGAFTRVHEGVLAIWREIGSAAGVHGVVQPAALPHAVHSSSDKHDVSVTRPFVCKSTDPDRWGAYLPLRVDCQAAAKTRTDKGFHRDQNLLPLRLCGPHLDLLPPRQRASLRGSRLGLLGGWRLRPLLPANAHAVPPLLHGAPLLALCRGAGTRALPRTKKHYVSGSADAAAELFPVARSHLSAAAAVIQAGPPPACFTARRQRL